MNIYVCICGMFLNCVRGGVGGSIIDKLLIWGRYKCLDFLMVEIGYSKGLWNW